MEEDIKQAGKEDAGQVKLSEVIRATLKHWPWILLSLTVCLILAIFNVLRAVPQYKRDASIVIKEDQKHGTAGFDLSGLADLGFMNSNTNLFDEVNRLRSRDLNAEVVEKLDLETSYWQPGVFHDKILYGGEIPVKAEFSSGLDEEGMSFKIKIDSKDSFTISKLKIGSKGKEESVKQGSYRFGQPIRTPDGSFVINKTPGFAIDKKGDNEFVVTKDSKYGATKGLESSVNITFKRNEGNTVGISVTNASPKMAEDIINAIIDVYNQRWIDSRNQIAISTNEFIDERLRVIENELGNVENDISTYQSQHMIPDLQKAAELYLSGSQESDVAMLELNNRLQVAKFMRDHVANEKNRSQIIPANAGIDNRGLEEMIKVYNEKAVVRKQLADNSSESHPLVIDLDSQLADMRANIIKSLDNEVSALGTQIRNLQSNMNRNSSNIAQTPVQAKYLLSVERQQKVKESLYLYLLQKREENQLSQAFTAYNTEIIARPHGGPKPVSPHMFRMMVLALFFGICIPFGAEYFLMVTNNKIRTRKDLEKLKAPLLGEIPQYKFPRSDKNHNTLVVKQGERDVVNESFRLLRSNLRFVSGEADNCEVEMFTSFIPGSGKTFITMNLAATYALRSKKTLVIDCDMRRAATSEYVGSPRRGIADFLSGHIADVNEVIVSGKLLPNLDVLPVGTIPPNPTELLESPKFAETIEKLRSEYAFILIDCPPIENMADSQVINESCDRAVFIIRAGALEKSMIGDLNEIFTQKKFKNLGVVLNSVSLASTGYGSYGKHGYGYGYGNVQPKDNK